jgi:hypothetical protein
MSDIIELIVEYKDAFCDYVISGKRYAEARECYAILESRISAMQEVVDKAVKYSDYFNDHVGCNCNLCLLIRAIDKLNEACK